MKKNILMLIIILIFLVGCGKEKETSESNQVKATSEVTVEKMTYDDIINLPTRYWHEDFIGFDTLQHYIDDIKSRGVYKSVNPIVVKIKKVNYYCDLKNDGDPISYNNPHGHTEYECEVVKIADGYEEGIKVGDTFIAKMESYLMPEWEELFELIEKNTGKKVDKRDDLKEIETCSFIIEPEKGKKYTQEFIDNEYPLREGALYSCVYSTYFDDSFFCWYFYPTENEQEFLKLINETYRVDHYNMGISKEVSEMFK